MSRHLAVLRGAGLVRDRREGTKVYYTLAPLTDRLAPFAEPVAAVGRSQHPDLDRLEECLRNRTEQAQSFADRAAAEWDEVGRLLHSSAASLLALANLTPRGLTLADLGTGTGLMLPFLAAAGKRVYAVDQSARMLDRARARCRELGIGNVTFIQAAIEALDRQLPPCDGVLLHFVLHQVARPATVLRRVRSLLGPDGRLVIVDRVRHEDERAKATFGSIWLGFAHAQIRNWTESAGLQLDYWHTLAEPGPDRTEPVEIFVAAAE